MKPLLLVDHSWMLWRSFHSHKSLAVYESGEERKTNVHFGFTELVESIHNVFGKCPVLFCEDRPPYKKAENYPSYKEGRQKNEGDRSYVHFVDSEVRGLVSICPWVFFCGSDGMECDDLAANLFYKNKEKFDVFIFASDDDFMQLLCDGANIVKGFKEEGLNYKTSEQLSEKYGVSPEDLLHFRALVGDSSDNLKPAFPRIRKKFAAEFAKAWREEGFEKALDLPSAKKYRDRLLSSETLMPNFEIMNLKKYSEKENQFETETYCYDRNESKSLIESLSLKKYEKFLKQEKLL